PLPTDIRTCVARLAFAIAPRQRSYPPVLSEDGAPGHGTLIACVRVRPRGNCGPGDAVGEWVRRKGDAREEGGIRGKTVGTWGRRGLSSVPFAQQAPTPPTSSPSPPQQLRAVSLGVVPYPA